VDGEPLGRLVERLQAICLERGATVATAESCTGGLIAKLLTDTAGSSGYFKGGVVTYSNETKSALLGVPADELASHGAVSAQVARSMAVGVRARVGASHSLAVTGVSGPGGGSPSKPIGLTYVAVVDEYGTNVQRFVWSGDRAANRESTARAGIEMLTARLTSVVGSGTE
jgi:PncC family amidohydrolase